MCHRFNEIIVFEFSQRQHTDESIYMHVHVYVSLVYNFKVDDPLLFPYRNSILLWAYRMT